MKAYITDDIKTNQFIIEIYNNATLSEKLTNKQFTFSKAMDRLDCLGILKENIFYRHNINETYGICCI